VGCDRCQSSVASVQSNKERWPFCCYYLLSKAKVKFNMRHIQPQFPMAESHKQKITGLRDQGTKRLVLRIGMTFVQA